jgi:hypothetical protein
MTGKIDIGGYFDKLTKRGRGGRRLDHAATVGSDDDRDGAIDEATDEAGAPGDAASRGGVADVLKDMLGKGRSGARRTADKVRTKAPRLPRRKSADRLPPEGVVTIEYSPRRDGDPDPGEVVWTWVPFEEDPDQGKDRPVVIIGRRGRNLVGVPLTTKPNDREAQVNLGTGGWDPKRRTSYARIWRMLDIDADRTRREGSVLDERRFEALVKAVDEYYEIRRPAASVSADDDYDY